MLGNSGLTRSDDKYLFELYVNRSKQTRFKKERDSIRQDNTIHKSSINVVVVCFLVGFLGVFQR